MIITKHSNFRASLLLPLLLLGGCATFEDFLDTIRRDRVPPAVPLAERPVEEPILANHFVLESPEQSVIGMPQIVYPRADDTLSDLARSYGLGYDELIAANPTVDPWLPGESTPVLLPTQYVLPDVPRTGVVLNIASKRLFYFPEVPDGQAQVVKTYPIGIGRVGWETPLGATKVVAKARDPHWYVPASVRREHAEQGNPLPAVVPPGPENPLGTRVLKLDMPGYLIHGTNQPYGVGMRVSHGCVRLYPENIELLYELVEIGETVMIINEPFLIGELDGQVYFEGHQPLEDDALDVEQRLALLFDRYAEQSEAGLKKREQDHVRAIASVGSGVPALIAAHDADEVFARARLVHNIVTTDPDAPTLIEVREMIDAALQEGELEAEPM
ncbi:MAG: L,D-transpeptidase family protein [Gammaproteobacteria bacterium]|nr:L,D-transpeptidase family protein [Gammaproteobacteria bacterium]